MVTTEVNLRGRFHNGDNSVGIQALLNFCESNSDFQLPAVQDLVVPTYSNSGAGRLVETGHEISGKLHEVVLRIILLEQSAWHQTFSNLTSGYEGLGENHWKIVSFGPDRCVPPSQMRKLTGRVVHFEDNHEQVHKAETASANTVVRPYAETDIAVVGMACTVAGAEDLAGFWNILREGKSQHREIVPGAADNSNRFGFETPFRPEPTDPGRKWYGNFISSHDSFDHKFFKKTPREAASMDPQQRLLLQVAYQALEQSGYFNNESSERHIGCYIGVCATDYENNVACHAPNAFSATGNLRSFIAGKVSHYFGWTGPGLTIDTACSASAVAIHQACMAILGGECTSALAGGTNMMTQPLWYQNLAAASFLSPTGQCKPFDAGADGYCRGEAIAAVYLKKMSAALADGDQILGAITATAVYQNQNCTPIVVPNAPSLSHLFRTVLAKSKLEPGQVSVVEAHGTGTPVGDPAEYDSIRQALGGPLVRRSQNLQFGSVKGLVGHTEGASGVVSLIKIILMLQQGFVPPQASFKTLNPAINALPEADRMEVTTRLTPWENEFRAALINNYGASGSNASMVVVQAPKQSFPNRPITEVESSYPFWLAGADERSIQAYARKLRDFIRHQSRDVSIRDIAFNLFRQSNRTLEKSVIFSCLTIDELDRKLAAIEQGSDKATITMSLPSRSRPVILCFGGQVSTFVGLDKGVYHSSAVLRSHLDACDAVCRSLLGDEGSIYPAIFASAPASDPVKLQVMLFSMQYAAAKSWIECGVKPAAVVGHSFGELTALCVSGALDLNNALKLVAGRAAIIRDKWPASEGGAMMAVEGDLREVEMLLGASSKSGRVGDRPVVACYNGPRSFTLAGTAQAIGQVAETISGGTTYAGIRFKKLNVSHAFHSPLVDPLVHDLERIVGDKIVFKQPLIRLERATETSTSGNDLTAKFVADHMRNPVYFSHAVQRLAVDFPSAVWLEAGSNSTITNMASRALGANSHNKESPHHFQALNITSTSAGVCKTDGMRQLVDTTVALWKAGSRVVYWPHSRLQTREYKTMLLPPYQFAEHKHWLEFKTPPMASAVPSHTENTKDEIPTGLWTFTGYEDGEKRQHARFRINTESKEYKEIIAGHVIAGTAPICPATVQVDVVIEALYSIIPDDKNNPEGKTMPQINRVNNLAPICIDPARFVWLDLVPSGPAGGQSWQWKIWSADVQGKGTVVHVTGDIALSPVQDPQSQAEFARYARLIDYARCVEVLNCQDADDVIVGQRNIYRLFSEVVDYSEQYFGLRKLVGRRNESAGVVTRKHNGKTWLDPYLGDCFSQVGGVWVNCMTEKQEGDMFIANGFERWARSPELYYDDSHNKEWPVEWHVLARHARAATGSAFLTDIFVFDPRTGAMTEMILGINYAKVAKASMSKLLTRLTAPGTPELRVPATSSIQEQTPKPDSRTTNVVLDSNQHHEKSEKKGASAKGTTTSAKITGELMARLKTVLADISGLEVDEIKGDVELADIGIDSLMGMEMARDIEKEFQCTLDNDKLMHVTDLPSLFKCLLSALDVHVENGFDEGSNSSSASASDKSSGLTTPEVTPALSTVLEGPAGYIKDLSLMASDVLGAFGESKLLTDHFITSHQCSNYMHGVMPKQTLMCVALALEAFEQLGCHIRSAQPGHRLPRIAHLPQHQRLAEYLYSMLEETRVIDMDGEQIIRTGIPVPTKPSEQILHELVQEHPKHAIASRLAHWTGSKLADVLSGNADGIKLIFGDGRGRELVSGLYGDSLLNKLSYEQMCDFLTKLISRLKREDHQGPLKILEMGAGTGGTTKWLVPVLAETGFPVEYTFTDLSASFVAIARKQYKSYPFMKFRVHDIEKPPAEELMHSQHIVIASNAVHATRSLAQSTANIRKMLRPDGFLMMLEMTETLHWVDFIFGTLEGWWLFDDGRRHAIAPESRWEQELHRAGYGHVDWTDGAQPETRIQKVFIALATGLQHDRLPSPSTSTPALHDQDLLYDHAGRREETDEYVKKSVHGFGLPAGAKENGRAAQLAFPGRKQGACVLVTGGTGSLGSHLVAHLANLPEVGAVICLNRRHRSQNAKERQQEALMIKGIQLSTDALAKLLVWEVDTAKARFGLASNQYEQIADRLTHVVHNAWPMNGKRPLKAFEPQFSTMRNLIDLAGDAWQRHPERGPVSFQFVSSIATVGHCPLRTGKADVPEEQVQIEDVLPNGYGDAKFVCEQMLALTLGRDEYKSIFRAMTVRLGQVAGSSTSGYWNDMEHFAFLVKSSQTLGVLPELQGLMSWTPVNIVAATLAELLLSEAQCYPVYHVDNPIRQPWEESLSVLADAIGLLASKKRTVPFSEWIRRVRAFPGSEIDNPAARLVDFLERDFERMSCGGVLLKTEKCREHSETLRKTGPVSEDVMRAYVAAWKKSGFLR